MPQRIDPDIDTCPKCGGALVISFASSDMFTTTYILKCEKCGVLYRREESKPRFVHPAPDAA